MTQTDKVISFIKCNGNITQRDAYNLGIYRLASRISDLKRQGVEIDTEMKQVTNKDGSTSRIAVYRLGDANG